jgi:hypothetical protein
MQFGLQNNKGKGQLTPLDELPLLEKENAQRKVFGGNLETTLIRL